LNGYRGVAVVALATLLAALVLAAGAHAKPAADAPPVASRLAKALAVPHVNQARSAALAVDLFTGEVVFARNPKLSLAPASTEKLAVAFATLALLGPAHQLETHVYGDGVLTGTTWTGDLVLKGFGDPTLATRDLRSLAAKVRAEGIRRVEGGIVGDESYFDTRRTADGWRSWYFINESPPLSALVVDRARFGGRTTANPALAAATAFRAELVRAGVAVAGAARVGRAEPDAFLVAADRSAPLGRIVRTMGVESDNFTAEMLLKQLGALESSPGTSAGGAETIRRVLAEAGVPLGGVRVVDGSGLSLLNRLTAEALVAILRAAWDDPLLRGALLSALPVAGRTGTLRGRLRAAPTVGQVFAKTGTTRLACTLAGYVSNRYVFAVLQNGPPLSSWWARQAQDRFVTVLARE
jgi:D-alanyl-D-alanine carboxypeptidase/D-alanyl-D-alanine-endopeptidase (penicillin-binding protein 4)